MSLEDKPAGGTALTPLGQSLKPVVMALEAWGKQHVLCRDGQKFIIPPVTEVAA